MKEETIKIIQITVESKKYYVSNGSPYKDTVNTHEIFGLGDDGQVYQWAEHSFWNDPKYHSEKIVGWKLYVPK